VRASWTTLPAPPLHCRRTPRRRCHGRGAFAIPLRRQRPPGACPFALGGRKRHRRRARVPMPPTTARGARRGSISATFWHGYNSVLRTGTPQLHTYHLPHPPSQCQLGRPPPCCRDASRYITAPAALNVRAELPISGLQTSCHLFGCDGTCRGRRCAYTTVAASSAGSMATRETAAL